MCHRSASARRPGRYFGSRLPPGLVAPFGLRSSGRWFRLSVSRRWFGANTFHRPACPAISAPKGMWPTCVQRPTTSQRLSMPSRPVAGPFWRPKRPHPRPAAEADKPSFRCLRLARRSAVLRYPLGECRRDANSLAPNGPEARTLRCARQELVRVPESNTKYGGLRGITGGKPTPVVEPSIGESSGIPNRKNLSPVTIGMLHPAVHRAGIFLVAGIASAGLT